MVLFVSTCNAMRVYNWTWMGRCAARGVLLLESHSSEKSRALLG